MGIYDFIKFAAAVFFFLLSFTVRDSRLCDYMRDLLDTEAVFLEPSACAAFQGPVRLGREAVCAKYIRDNDLADKMRRATHIVWATGGSMVPEAVREEYRNGGCLKT